MAHVEKAWRRRYQHRPRNGGKSDSLERWLSKITSPRPATPHRAQPPSRPGVHTGGPGGAVRRDARGVPAPQCYRRLALGRSFEAQRLVSARRQPLEPMTVWRNDVANAWLMSVVLWGGLIAVFGPALIPFKSRQPGLQPVRGRQLPRTLRTATAEERRIRAAPRCTAGTPTIVNQPVPLPPEHSDHHANPTRRYQTASDSRCAQPAQCSMHRRPCWTYFPPLWRKVMITGCRSTTAAISLGWTCTCAWEKALARYGAWHDGRLLVPGS